MEIYPFDRTKEDVFTETDISGIQADGISIRSGNKVIRLQVTEEVVIDDADAIKQELEAKFEESYNKLVSEFDQYRDQMKSTLSREKTKYREKKADLERQLSESRTLPALTRKHLHQGLSVALHGEQGLVWAYKTVYAPMFVGNRRIDPSFAKRLVTPVSIEAYVNGSGKIYDLIVRQILGNKKFYHYHSMSSSSDCWGNFEYSGKRIPNPDDMLKFLQEASYLLETINDMSIGTSNPRGLSRLATLEKHLLAPEDRPENDRTRSSTNSRNTRAGVDIEAQNQRVEEEVWST